MKLEKEKLIKRDKTMKWRQIPKKLESGKVKMVLQVKKWWMLTWHDCWYFYLNNGDKHWQHLTTDLDYPPEIENISKDYLYYSILGLMFKI